KNGELSVQVVPEDIAEISAFGQKERSIDYLYKKEKEHGNLFDSFLIAEECKREDRWKSQTIKNFPRKRKEAALLLPFLAEKELQLDLEEASGMHGEEENKRGLKIPYGINLFVSEENSCCLKLFDLTETRIKKMFVTSFDITKMNIKSTSIEELFLLDESAVEFFYNSIGRYELFVEKVSFGSNSKPQSEKFLKLIGRVHGGIVVSRKIKMLVFGKNNFFGFLEEARRAGQKEIHAEDLVVTQRGKNNVIEIETRTRIVVSKKISIKGNARVFLFIELGPEISHLDIDELQKLCRSPRIDMPKTSIQLTKNKISIGETQYVLQFLKKNITATDVFFFANKIKTPFKNTKITLVSEEMESISFKDKGLYVLLCITNEKIDVRHMTVVDMMDCLSNEEKEKIKKKVFVIRERLYMKNTGIFFMELLRETVFIPVIEVEVDCFTKDWGRFGKTIGVHVETNALLWNIGPGIKGAGEIKEKIGEMITQKEPVVENKNGYPKLVFKEDLEHEEQREQGESKEQFVAEYQVFEEFRDCLDSNLLGESPIIYIPDDLVFRGDAFWLQGEGGSPDDSCWDHLFEDSD
ncbi:MAG: uncharacterized protein A8A55_2208, partial [Amphiamblys sp. WSBS2006]